MKLSIHENLIEDNKNTEEKNKRILTESFSTSHIKTISGQIINKKVNY